MPSAVFALYWCCRQTSVLHTCLLVVPPQLRQLNGVEVTVVEKVDAGNMVGAATDGLVLIRRRFFPKGELEGGGGAVPPTAAGERHTHLLTEQQTWADFNGLLQPHCKAIAQ